MTKIAHATSQVQTFFARSGNSFAARRDAYRQEEWPDRPFFTITLTEDEASGTLLAHRLHIGPGQSVPAGARLLFDRLRRLTVDDRAVLEIEFSPSPGDLSPGASGRPEEYARPAVAWALEACPTIVLAADWRPGTAAGETHCRAAPVQVVFRSPFDQVERWEAFLRQRLRPDNRLVVAHLIGGCA